VRSAKKDAGKPLQFSIPGPQEKSLQQGEGGGMMKEKVTKMVGGCVLKKDKFAGPLNEKASSKEGWGQRSTMALQKPRKLFGETLRENGVKGNVRWTDKYTKNYAIRV